LARGRELPDGRKRDAHLCGFKAKSTFKERKRKGRFSTQSIPLDTDDQPRLQSTFANLTNNKT
jgi:hypothetical protein